MLSWNRGCWKKYLALPMFVVICLLSKMITNAMTNKITMEPDIDIHEYHTHHGNYEYRQHEKGGQGLLHRILQVAKPLGGGVAVPWDADKPPDNGGINPFIPAGTYSPVPPPG